MLENISFKYQFKIVCLEKYGSEEYGLCSKKLYPTNGWKKNYGILWTYQAPGRI